MHKENSETGSPEELNRTIKVESLVRCSDIFEGLSDSWGTEDDPDGYARAVRKENETHG